MGMKIATWNVNSLRVRLSHLMAWVEKEKPDVMLLQELKTLKDPVLCEALEDQGYNVCFVGQKTYNGVAILSKSPLEDVVEILPGDAFDQEARYVQAYVGGWCVASIYVPNGQALGTPHFEKKKRFLMRLQAHVQTLKQRYTHILLGGDFNIVPSDVDVYDPEAWREHILCSTEERKAFQEILEQGFVDVWAHCYPDTKGYTWWDYRAAGFRRNLGLRIDHLLISDPTHLVSVGVDQEPRRWERPSDHAPVWCVVRGI